MPRKRRESEDEVRGGNRRAPMYAVLARELLRHVGQERVEVASARRVDRRDEVTAEVIEGVLEREKRRLLAAMEALRRGEPRVDLVHPLPLEPQVNDTGLELRGDVVEASRAAARGWSPSLSRG